MVTCQRDGNTVKKKWRKWYAEYYLVFLLKDDWFLEIILLITKSGGPNTKMFLTWKSLTVPLFPLTFSRKCKWIQFSVFFETFSGI